MTLLHEQLHFSDLLKKVGMIAKSADFTSLTQLSVGL